MPEDAKEAMGHGIRAKRSKSGAGGEEGSSGIVRAVVAMASAHKMATTAEGVETEERRDMLRQLQCEEMQGFLFSAAKQASEIRQMVSADRTKELVASS
jgi:EAL domain-containing protein (putative c-di-GMP-specific phosphodiesterase class I)